jgi:hypothetical protein
VGIKFDDCDYEALPINALVLQAGLLQKKTRGMKNNRGWKKRMDVRV